MRQFGCIELTVTDALLLRDAIRPLVSVQPFEPGAAIAFCEKLYDGLLKMKANDLDAINLPVDEREALIINHYVGNEDWQNAMRVLEQTWLALYELRYDRTYPRPAATAPLATAPLSVDEGRGAYAA